MCPYSQEQDVYDTTGLDTTQVQSLTSKTAEQVTSLINNFITNADARINGFLKVPVTVRKERHTFENNPTEELGPQEDDFEFFSNDDPNGLVTDVYAVFDRSGHRYKLPYPKDCDELSESHSGYGTGTDCVLSTEPTIKKCGTGSIKAIKSSVATNTRLFIYPSTQNLHKRIGAWGFVGFWFYASDKTSSFTLRLYDDTGNYDEETFTVPLSNTWCLVQLNLTDFTGHTGDIDWTTKYMEYFEVLSSKIGTFYFDNFNFNDGIFWTYPEGLICWSNPDCEPDAVVYVTYAFNPYSSTVPQPIKEASSKLAGVELINHLIGRRQAAIGFEVMSDDLEERPDRETLESTRNRLQREAETALSTIGYGTYEGMG
jgi:hypothetical protein